jgi:phospholipase C
VQLIDLAGDERRSTYPCFTGTKTIFDLLDDRGVSWKYYIRRKGPGLWNAPDAIRHIRFGADYAGVVSPETTILRDVARGRLPEVSWVIPGLDNSDHPRLNNGSGPSWVATVVNAIGESPYWDTTAIVVTWDDWGGWYDHVTPLEKTSYERGFRVPLLLISPYSKREYVSHTTYEFGSILRFVEENWGLGTLGATDEGSASIVDMLNFAQPPRRFRAIEGARPASYFLNRRLRRGDEDEPD